MYKALQTTAMLQYSEATGTQGRNSPTLNNEKLWSFSDHDSRVYFLIFAVHE